MKNVKEINKGGEPTVNNTIKLYSNEIVFRGHP